MESDDVTGRWDWSGQVDVSFICSLGIVRRFVATWLGNFGCALRSVVTALGVYV